jgi:DNA-binding NarL/FixJ family response regulator
LESQIFDNLKVYIVEDSAIIRGRILSLLGKINGIEIVGLSGEFQESNEEIKKLKPDILILDIRIIGGSGIELLDDVKDLLPSMSVIVFTNYQYPQYKKKCMDLGAKYFLDKSKDFDKISRIVSQMVS